ncbi:hypothetical protein B0H34DRAFT_863230 [Crassisporium funariophilum]|nr:hypothetical protein B0H34DRAFT_863230 [Crassisporium funariophilum]
MERRSSRLKAQAQDSTEQSVKIDDTTEGSAGVKKRKVYDDKASNPKIEPKSKKSRRKAPWSEKMSFALVPVDVLYEIFSQLEPLDLFHLARTTKDLYNILTSRSSSTIWDRARANMLLPMPPCPDDLSWPKYVDLSFGTQCHICAKNASCTTMWSARIRLCAKCQPKRFNKLQAARRSVHHDYPNDLFRHLPRITVLIPPKGKTEKRPSRKTIHFTELHEHWQDQYNNITDPDARAAWVNAQLVERTAIATHTSLYDEWKMDYEEALFENRKSTILERIEKLGWGQELAALSTDDKEHLFNQDLIVAAFEENLTEKILDGLKVFLVGYMAGVRDRRLQAQRSEMLTARLGILSEVHRDCTSGLPINSIYPTVSELFLHPVVQEIVNSEPEALFNRSHLAAVESSFLDIALDWRQQTEDKLMDMVKKVNKSEINRGTVFDLATTVFDCMACGNVLLRHPQVLVHKCATRDPGRRNQTDDPDRLTVERTLKQTYWNFPGWIVIKADTFLLASQIVKMCGFDPLSATARELDENGPIIECIKCNDRKGRATMTWLDALSHNYTNCGRESSEIMFESMTVLDKLETRKVKERMADDLSCKRAAISCRWMHCVYCKKAGNTIDLLEHIRKTYVSSILCQP